MQLGVRRDEVYQLHGGRADDEVVLIHLGASEEDGEDVRLPCHGVEHHGESQLQVASLHLDKINFVFI